MRIDGLRLRSAEPSALVDFYHRAFDARPCDLGVDLGEERIEIAPCAETSSELFLANETGFQHFAIAVADIDAAFARLSGFAGWRPISLGGPERLPQASGGATAFKFRDPEGHPLELLQFAPQAIPPAWRARFAAQPGRLFFGVDHTAITVRDGEASARFWAKFGFACEHRQSNDGPAQARLDGLAGLDDASVRILSLSPQGGARPGVELLDYRRPATVTRAAQDETTAATTVVLAGVNGDASEDRDLDGHRLEFASEPPNLSTTN